MVKEASAPSIRTVYSTVIMLMLFCFNNPSSAQLEPAKKIPNFNFSTLNDQQFTQKNLRKSTRILFLFFDATCTHCQYETQLIGSHYKDFKDTEFYLVSMDQKQQIQKFMSTYGKQLYGKSNVTVLADPKRQFIQNFTPAQYPALYIYNQDHKLLKYWDTPVNIDQVLSVIYTP